MCGIAGIAGNNAQVHQPLVAQMVKQLKYRGPDGDGLWASPSCVLGHTRLSIIDLEGGKQPMTSAHAPFTITLNGEVYGYQKIKRQYSDYPFQTNSDTEVIFALYQRHGINMMPHITGMFAFALYDAAKAQLVLARDRFGEKPLYYAFTPAGQLVFASDSRAIHQTGLVNSKVDEQAIAHYLQHLYVPVNGSVYKNIFTLPPGHMATYDVNTGAFQVSRYWELPAINTKVSMQEAAEHISHLLSEAVNSQLVADVPVGCFLSGGLDSTTVTALAAQHQPNLQTFAFGFQDVNSDMPYARDVAAHYHTRHTELWDKTENIADLLQTMARVYDAPFGDASSIPTYLISREAARYVKVALTGDGADELFAGYGYYYQPLLHYHKYPSAISSALTLCYRVASRVARAAGISPASLIQRRVGAELSAAHPTLLEAHYHRRSYMQASTLQTLGLQPAPMPVPGFTATGTVEDAFAADIQHYLPGDLLVKTDRASMANGLELRTPFLDTALTSYCLSLPYTLKMNTTSDKLVMRKAFSHLWPESVQKRSKSGFSPNVSAWLNRSEVKQMKADIFEASHSEIYQYLDMKGVQRESRNNTWNSWLLLVLAVWLNENK